MIIKKCKFKEFSNDKFNDEFRKKIFNLKIYYFTTGFKLIKDFKLQTLSLWFTGYNRIRIRNFMILQEYYECSVNIFKFKLREMF